MIKLYCGDCLIESDKIESGSVDLILTDLPYGTVKGANFDSWEGKKTDWDNVIDTNKIYNIANRILRKNGKMVLFCQEPFTTELINKRIIDPLGRGNIEFNGIIRTNDELINNELNYAFNFIDRHSM